MKKKTTPKSEKEIDKLVIAQADHDSAWEKPVQVRRSKSEAVSIPAEVASRAAFFARLHREPSLEHWIKKVIAERIDIEEAAFADAKRDLATQ
ncbi:MAG: hypothetical protein ACRD9S_14395 [Pyrinomonadaceae bacterium]